MTRAPALALLALLAACGTRQAEKCPGSPIGVFTFTLTDPGGTRPFCARLPAEGTTVVGAFRGVLSSDPALGTAAICVEDGKDLTQAYHGRIDDGVYAMATSSGLAVLDVCGANCATTATVRIAGSIDGTGGFAGTLTERFEDAKGDCGACAFPCEAEYDLTGTP